MKSKFLLAALACTALAACGDSSTANQSAAANSAAPAQVELADAGNASAAAEVTNAAAPAADPAEVIKTREAHYKEIGKAMKGIGDELKKGTPDVKVIQAHAATIDRLAPQVPSWFPAGSGPEAGVKTEARAEIWSKPDEFREAAAKFAAAARQFNATAQTGDVAAIGAGMKQLGGSCKGCHEKFRTEEKH
ncbi:MAG: cytochrome [Alphaproteobacteria bacterium]|nr:cytochrome [Alphaproteobacteria bacterium]